MKHKRLILGLVLFVIATAFAWWERDFMILFHDLRTRNAPRTERMEVMYMAFFLSDAHANDVVSHLGIPVEVAGYPGEFPTPGVQLPTIPSTRKEFDRWFERISRQYTRVALVWPGPQGSTLGLEFRDGRRDSDIGLTPWYFAFLVFLVPVLYAPDMVKWAISRRRVRAGQCGQCGYDLRGSDGVCPECGAVMR